MIKLTPEKPPYYENIKQSKYLTQLITQSGGTDNPTAITTKNEIQTKNPVWTYEGTGHYQMILEVDLSITRWAAILGASDSDTKQQAIVMYPDNNTLELRQAITHTAAGVNGLEDFLVQIIIFN